MHKELMLGRSQLHSYTAIYKMLQVKFKAKLYIHNTISGIIFKIKIKTIT